MALLGPLDLLRALALAVAGADPARVQMYFNRHLLHEHYNFEYLGSNWNNPPTDLAPQADPDDVPVRVDQPHGAGDDARARALGRASCCCAAAAATPSWTDGRARGAARGTRARAGCARAPTSTARPARFSPTQIFGPLCLLARAVDADLRRREALHAGDAVPRRRRRDRRRRADARAGGAGCARCSARGSLRALPAALAVLVCLPAVAETERSQPDGLSHYNLLAGGFAGGASLGMNRQFWGILRGAHAGLGQRGSADNRRMYWHDVLGDALHMYKREGRLDMAVGDTGFGRARHPGVVDGPPGLGEALGRSTKAGSGRATAPSKPAYVRDREGVPLVIGYKRSVK